MKSARPKGGPAVLAVSLLLGLCLAASAATAPLEEIRSTVDSIIAILKDRTAPAAERKNRVSSLVRSRFDFRTMAQGVLATNWKKASDKEKERFIELFSELLEVTYRERIDAYNNERVEYDKEDVKTDRAVVDTRVVTATVEIPVQYKLLNKDGTWRAYDVVIEGVSLVRNYRDSYRDIVSREGMDGLLKKMERKIEEVKTDPGKAKDP